MQQMKEWPSESELLQRSLQTLHNVTAPAADKVVALKLVQELVEQVDVANGARNVAGHANAELEARAHASAMSMRPPRPLQCVVTSTGIIVL